jgi:hypothetical protein
MLASLKNAFADIFKSPDPNDDPDTRRENFLCAVRLLDGPIVAELLQRDPELAKTKELRGYLSWVNTFAGLPEKEAGVETLLALHAAGVDVKNGLALAIAYNITEEESGPRVIGQLLKAGVIDESARQDALRRAEAARCNETAALLRNAAPRPANISPAPV